MSSSTTGQIQYIAPGSVLTGISSTELSLLRRKQSKLERTSTTLEAEVADRPEHLKAVKSTLIFAQHEAGTAVCVDPRGYLLTCSHCIGETVDEWQANKRKWLLTYQGIALQAECQAWDSTRDLALLKIITIEISAPATSVPLDHIDLSTRALKVWTPIFCLGQPGAEDLESATYRKTKYNLLELSEGRYRGMRKGANPQDNAEIGALKHDAWTYWGHSGAPLCREDDGSLIGLHSSWDEETSMRHGIPGEAIGAFLELHLLGVETLVVDKVDVRGEREIIDLTAEDQES